MTMKVLLIYLELVFLHSQVLEVDNTCVACKKALLILDALKDYTRLSQPKDDEDLVNIKELGIYAESRVIVFHTYHRMKHDDSSGYPIIACLRTHFKRFTQKYQ